MFLPAYLKGLRIGDMPPRRVDEFVAISRTVQQRIFRRTGAMRKSFPAGAGWSHRTDRAEDYYLIVSRLVPYKRIDLAIEAFNQRADCTSPERP